MKMGILLYHILGKAGVGYKRIKQAGEGRLGSRGSYGRWTPIDETTKKRGAESPGADQKIILTQAASLPDDGKASGMKRTKTLY